jgi:Tol biopolymer transport system component
MTRLRALLVLLALLAVSAVGVTAAASSASATYPGRDGRIAFVRANQIYTMSPTGTGVTKLTSTGKNYRPHWSPDGKRIAYINETSTGAKDVWVMSGTGTTKQRVTTTGNVTSAGAVWSPNGATLAFAKPSADAPSSLYTVRSTSAFGAPKLVQGTYDDADVYVGTKSIPVDTYLAWSASNVIALKNGEDWNLDHAIWMYRPARGTMTELVATGGDCCGYLEWKDLFWGPSNQFGLTEKDLGNELETPNAPTHILYPYTSSTSPSSADNDTGGAPSPSGTYMALTNATSGTAQIFRVNANFTGRRLLTSGYQPDWQRVS